MKKLSKKQIEVIKILYNEKTYIVFMKGLHPCCFIHNNLKYKISTSTLFALESLKVIDNVKDDWSSSEYKLTKLGKDYAKDVVLSEPVIKKMIQNKDCSDIVIKPNDFVYTDRPYEFITKLEIKELRELFHRVWTDNAYGKYSKDNWKALRKYLETKLKIEL